MLCLKGCGFDARNQQPERCGCSDERCPCRNHDAPGVLCDADAVRMVTVRVVVTRDRFGCAAEMAHETVPMCEPCAAFHSAKAVR